MAKFLLIIFLFLAILLSTRGILAVDYSFNETTAAPRFDKEIGKEYTLKIMNESTTFIWRIFGQTFPSLRKSVDKVSLFIDIIDGIAYTSNDEIHFNVRYIQNFSGNVTQEFTGILYHEMTHVWQNDGAGTAPSGLIEGIADFVRLKADLAPAHWVKPGSGKKWDQGYAVTAYFLDYCNSLQKNGTFVADLNKKMRDGFSSNYFKDLLGKSVDKLWREYKKQYEYGN